MLSAIVVLVSVARPPAFAIAPPLAVAVFDERVESRIESVPLASLAIAPPVVARVAAERVVHEADVAEVVDARRRWLADPPEIVKPVNVAVTPLATVNTPDAVAAARS